MTTPSKYIKPICVLFLIIIIIASSGCLEPTGCLPVVVDNKEVTLLPNLQTLTVTISGEEYTYYNPTLVTFNQLEINHTYLMRFQPMAVEKPEIELCGEIS